MACEYWVFHEDKGDASTVITPLYPLHSHATRIKIRGSSFRAEIFLRPSDLEQEALQESYATAHIADHVLAGCLPAADLVSGIVTCSYLADIDRVQTILTHVLVDRHLMAL